MNTGSSDFGKMFITQFAGPHKRKTQQIIYRYSKENPQMFQ